MNASYADRDVTVHPSGLTLLVEEQHVAPVVAIQVWVRVGSGDETDAEAGLAHVHEHMLFKGTASRGVGEIARDIEAVGGSINAWTSFDQTVYHVVVPARHAERGLDVLLDAVVHSAFDAEELERELEVIQEEIRQGEDQPGRVLSRALFETAFATHPYGRPVIGTPESVASFTREDVVRFFDRWYRPENMTLVVVGDIAETDVVDAVDRTFGRQPRGFRPAAPRAIEPPQSATRVRVLQRDVQEAHASIAFHAPELSHEDTPALELLTLLLGQGDSSMLFERVQRQQRLASDVYAYLYTPAEPGLLMLGSRFGGGEREVSAEQVVTAILEVVADLHDELVSSDDLRRAVRNVESDAIYQRQTVQGTAQRLGFFHVVAGGVAFESRFVELARQVSAEDLRRVARTYLRPERCTVALLLPEAVEAPSETAVTAWVTRAFERRTVLAPAEEVTLDDVGVARFELPSGTVLLVQPDHTAPIVSIRAAVLAGTLAEDDSTLGASNVLAELLTSGTRIRDAATLAREVDSMAASLAGFSGRNTIGMRMTALRRDLDAAIELFVDALFHSELPEDELLRVKEEVLADLATQDDDVAGTTFRTFSETMYAGHPYARSVLGTVESVGGLDRDELLEFYHRLVQPSRMVISVVGDVEPAEMARTFGAHLVDSSAAAPRALPAFDRPVEVNEPRRIDRSRDRQQAHVVLGFPADPMYGEHRPALDVLAAVLGGQGGRLFLELRDRQSLAYSVSAFNSSGLDVGSFAFYIATSPEKVEQALEGMRREIAQLREHGVGEEELERARQFLIGRRDIGLQRQSTRAGLLLFDELYGAGHLWSSGYAERIGAVDSEALQRAIEAVFVPEREVVVVTRPDAD
jgi:zinc protease